MTEEKPGKKDRDKAEAPKAGRPGWKWIASAVAIGLAVAAVAYGAGRIQGLFEVAAVRAETAAAAEARRTERGRLSAFEARRELGLALLAVDDRNFGIARDHIRAAATKLRAAGLEDPGTAALAGDIEAADVEVTGDPAPQRARIRSLVDRFDQVLASFGELEPLPGSEPAAEPAAETNP